jgi:hypothetical protein
MNPIEEGGIFALDAFHLPDLCDPERTPIVGSNDIPRSVKYRSTLLSSSGAGVGIEIDSAESRS